MEANSNQYYQGNVRERKEIKRESKRVDTVIYFTEVWF
jgi:hypothetical protein